MPKYLLTNEVIVTELWKMLVTNPAYSEDLTTKAKVGKAAVCTFFKFRPGVLVDTAGDYPDISLAKSGWRTDGALNGSFAAGNWTFKVRLESDTKYGFSVKVGARITKSANANGSNATLIIETLSPNVIQIPASAGGSVSDTWIWDAPEISMSNEYLFIEYRIHIQVAGTNVACQCSFACDEDPAVADESVLTTTFTPTPYLKGFSDSGNGSDIFEHEGTTFWDKIYRDARYAYKEMLRLTSDGGVQDLSPLYNSNTKVISDSLTPYLLQNALYMYIMTGESQYLQKARDVADDIDSKMLDGTTNLICVYTKSAGKDNTTGIATSVLYLKPLALLAYYDSAYLTLLNKIATAVVNYHISPTTGLIYQLVAGNGTVTDNDCSWPLRGNQGVEGLLMAFELTGNTTYRDKAKGILDKFWDLRNTTTKIFPDKVDGDNLVVIEDYQRQYSTGGYIKACLYYYYLTGNTTYKDRAAEYADGICTYFWRPTPPSWYYRVNTSGTPTYDVLEGNFTDLDLGLLWLYEVTGTANYLTKALTNFNTSYQITALDTRFNLVAHAVNTDGSLSSPQSAMEFAFQAMPMQSLFLYRQSYDLTLLCNLQNFYTETVVRHKRDFYGYQEYINLPTFGDDAYSYTRSSRACHELCEWLHFVFRPSSGVSVVWRDIAGNKMTYPINAGVGYSVIGGFWFNKVHFNLSTRVITLDEVTGAGTITLEESFEISSAKKDGVDYSGFSRNVLTTVTGTHSYEITIKMSPTEYSSSGAFQSAESESQSDTLLTDWQDKVTLDVNIQKTTEDWLILWSAETSYNNTASGPKARITVDGVEKDYVYYRCPVVNVWENRTAGFLLLTLNQGVRTIKLQYCTGNALYTASIRRARIFAWKVEDLTVDYTAEEGETNLGSPTEYTDKLSKTFTGDGSTYLILGMARIRGDVANNYIWSRFYNSTDDVIISETYYNVFGSSSHFPVFGLDVLKISGDKVFKLQHKRGTGTTNIYSLNARICIIKLNSLVFALQEEERETTDTDTTYKKKEEQFYLVPSKAKFLALNTLVHWNDIGAQVGSKVERDTTIENETNPAGYTTYIASRWGTLRFRQYSFVQGWTEYFAQYIKKFTSGNSSYAKHAKLLFIQEPLVFIETKNFSDSGLGSELFETPFKALPFGDIGSGSDVFSLLQEKAFGDSGLGSEVFSILKAMGFTDAGSGVDVFQILFKAMEFEDTGQGSETFNIPFKAMGFSDSGSGIDIFKLLRELSFVDLGSGVDVFIIPLKALGFTDVGTATDIFTKEIITAILKEFFDSGAGSDVFIIPYKELKFSETGLGTDTFTITFKTKGFFDIGSGIEVFTIPFKTMKFSDSALGSDVFSVLLSVQFSDAGSGADVFTQALVGWLEKQFSESGTGTDSFKIVFRSMGFSDAGLGSDVFSISFKTLKFADVGSGLESFTLLREIAFSDFGSGLDAFTVTWRALKFTDTASGIDVFLTPFKALKFSDIGTGTDFFFLFFEKSFSDVAYGIEVFEYILPVPPLIVHVILLGDTGSVTLLGDEGEVTLLGDEGEVTLYA